MAQVQVSKHWGNDLIVGRNTPRSRLVWRVLVVAATLSVLVHVNGETINVGGVSISNFFILCFVLPHFARVGLLSRFPRAYLMPLALLIAIAGLKFISGGFGWTAYIAQSLFFLFFPYFIAQRGLSELFVKTLFYFVVASQIWLLFINNFTLPTGDLGGFFVSRRTVHSLMLGAVTLMFLGLIKHERVRLALLIGIGGLLLISEARGAALIFVMSSLVFGGELFSTRSRIAILVAAVFTGVSVFWWQRELVQHYLALLSTSGGSSTGYRLYLLQVLIDEFGRYWLSGLPDVEVQHLLADRFTEGRLNLRFAIDNSLTFIALKFGLLPLALLVSIAIRLALLRQAYPAYLLGWLLLDDILGSALGWMLLGQALLTFNTIATSRLERRHSNLSDVSTREPDLG